MTNKKINGLRDTQVKVGIRAMELKWAKVNAETCELVETATQRVIAAAHPKHKEALNQQTKTSEDSSSDEAKRAGTSHPAKRARVAKASNPAPTRSRRRRKQPPAATLETPIKTDASASGSNATSEVTSHMPSTYPPVPGSILGSEPYPLQTPLYGGQYLSATSGLTPSFGATMSRAQLSHQFGSQMDPRLGHFGFESSHFGGGSFPNGMGGGYDNRLNQEATYQTLHPLDSAHGIPGVDMRHHGVQFGPVFLDPNLQTTHAHAQASPVLAYDNNLAEGDIFGRVGVTGTATHSGSGVNTVNSGLAEETELAGH
jgi:hypothetical protein